MYRTDESEGHYCPGNSNTTTNGMKPPCRVSRKLILVWQSRRGHFAECYHSNFLCEKLAAVLAFLRVHFLSSQRMLLFHRKRKEPVVTGCVGWELSGIFGMPQSQLWEPLRSQASQAWDRYYGSSREPHFRNTVYPEVGRNTWNFNTSSFQKCANFLKEILKSIFSAGLPNSMFYKILL